MTRYCNWPVCLNETQAALLAREIREEEMTGEPSAIYLEAYPVDQREICRCQEPPGLLDPDELPLFPETFGELLRELFNPTNRPCPEYPVTHTFRVPRTRYDSHGEPLPQPLRPSLTVEHTPPAAFNREPYEKALAAASRPLSSSIGYSAACGTK